MYSEQIEQLIKSVIADGVITEKERAVLHKRAVAEGIDEDEIDVYVEGLIALMKSDAPKSEVPAGKAKQTRRKSVPKSVNIDFNKANRITNEINKIKLFQINNQQEVLAALKYNSPDLYTQTLFNISDAVFKKDILTLIDYFLHKNSCDFDAFGLVYALLKTFKKMLFVLCNSGLTAEQIGITQKQYSGIKYYNQGLSKEYLEKSILFLSSIDERIKTGKLDIPKESLIDYIICNVISYNV